MFTPLVFLVIPYCKSKLDKVQLRWTHGIRGAALATRIEGFVNSFGDSCSAAATGIGWILCNSFRGIYYRIRSRHANP